MKIRKAKKGDFKAIAKILKEESAKKPYNEKYTIQKSLEEIKEFSEDELFVYEIDKEIIGFIASYVTKDEKTKAYIRELWLKPNFQGKGFGKLFVKFIEAKYKKKGIKKIRLVSHKKSKAFGFYKKLNYKDTTNLVFLEKKLK